jgi:hypothetical protein
LPVVFVARENGGDGQMSHHHLTFPAALWCERLARHGIESHEGCSVVLSLHLSCGLEARQTFSATLAFNERAQLRHRPRRCLSITEEGDRQHWRRVRRFGVVFVLARCITTNCCHHVRHCTMRSCNIACFHTLIVLMHPPASCKGQAGADTPLSC